MNAESTTPENWNLGHLLKVCNDAKPKKIDDKNIKAEEHRKQIEPWLTALFQSEHLSLLVGSGISSAVFSLANDNNHYMTMPNFEVPAFKEQMESAVKTSAKKAGRGVGNFEDQIRVANELIKGLEIYLRAEVEGVDKLKKDLEEFKQAIHVSLLNFANSILVSENKITNSDSAGKAAEYLMSFLVSFASRSATRERLNIFTTNYDRVIEFGAELSGIRLIDRFIGSISPIFRSSRLEIDMHYNPPGIRGEPRYLEGVAYFAKLHGSLDWIYQNGNVRRIALPYGAESISTYLTNDVSNLMIYPNASKDRETSEYPYVELFRDFAAAVCRPNSTLVIYGYSFGDEHINRVIMDMLTIPSTHLVIISYTDEGDRIQRFYNSLNRPLQISLLLGKHFGNLEILVNNYLPKPAIDKTTFRMEEILKARGWKNESIENNKKELIENKSNAPEEEAVEN